MSAADDADTVLLTLAALVFVNAQHPACSVQVTSRAHGAHDGPLPALQRANLCHTIESYFTLSITLFRD